MRKKIEEHAKTGYSSSPHDFSEQQIDLIIKHDCECDNCGKSIFDMWDFPEVNTDKNELLCEECYYEEYRTICPVCEESCETEDITEMFFITKQTSKTVHKPIGLYKIMKYPFYYGDCIFGFDAFFEGAIKCISTIDIEEALSIRYPNSNKEILLDCICSECAERYTTNNNFIESEPRYTILIQHERDKFFKDYSDERIHRTRQDMIHRRITFRGMLQKHNSKQGKEATNETKN